MQNATVREYTRRCDTVENIHEVIGCSKSEIVIKKVSLLIRSPENFLSYFSFFIFPLNISDFFFLLDIIDIFIFSPCLYLSEGDIEDYRTVPSLSFYSVVNYLLYFAMFVFICINLHCSILFSIPLSVDCTKRLIMA